MKKKLMMVAVFLGTLSLGACVDDNESASVTSVREAKAEQLKSIAAMNTAEAAAKKVLADAEAVLKAAQAEAEKANAAKATAEAEMIKKQTELIELQKEAAKLQNDAALIENQKKQAELETQLSELEVTKKQAEATLKKIADNMTIQEQQTTLALAYLQLNMKKAQQELLDYDKALAEAATAAEKTQLEAERAKLQTLATNYSGAVNKLIEAQQTLSAYKNNLVRLESDLTDIKAYKEKAIAENNNQIALYQLKIEKYKQYTNYTADITTLKNKQQELYASSGLAYDKYIAAQKAYNNVSVDQDAINEAWLKIENDDFYQFVVNRKVKGEDGISYYVGSYFSDIISDSYITDNPVEYAGYTCYIGRLTYIFDYSFNSDIRQVELIVNQRLNNIKSWKESVQDDLTSYKKQYDGAGPVLDYWGNSLLDIEGNATTKNAITYTKELKTAYEAETDAGKKANYKSLYETALNRELVLKDLVESYSTTINSYENRINALKKAWTLYQGATDSNKALQAKVKAYNDTNVQVYANKETANKAYIDAMLAYNAVNTELQAVSNLLDGDWNTGASNIAYQIKDLEDNIVSLQKVNADVSSITSTEEAITYQKARITAQEAIVKVKQVAVANAKADLDAAMPKSE